jgi:hypothetical protein
MILFILKFIDNMVGLIYWAIVLAGIPFSLLSWTFQFLSTAWIYRVADPLTYKVEYLESKRLKGNLTNGNM